MAYFIISWFRDYLYISLGGNRVTIPRWYFNLFVVFLISGLWHGASWSYVFWGGINGIYLIFAIISEKHRNKFNSKIGLDKLPFLHNTLQVIVTFSLTCFGWIFFRAHGVRDAFYIIYHTIADLPNLIKNALHGHHVIKPLGLATSEILFCFVLINFSGNCSIFPR